MVFFICINYYNLLNYYILLVNNDYYALQVGNYLFNNCYAIYIIIKDIIVIKDIIIIKDITTIKDIIMVKNQVVVLNRNLGDMLVDIMEGNFIRKGVVDKMVVKMH